MKINLIHGIIVIILLCLCLFDMPYWYFMFVRFVTAMSCVYRWFMAYENNKDSLMWIFAWIAILFQPFLKIHLWRLVRNIVDIILAVFILIMMIYFSKKEKVK